jgi:hypothetical protein
MIPLSPVTQSLHQCVYCLTALEVMGWYMPGMRSLADLRCKTCGREFFGDMATGQALYTPMLLEKKTGEVFDQHNVNWFADWFRESYASRVDSPVPFVVVEQLPITRPVVLLNCIDTLYGHSLLKLLNAQYYIDQQPDLDLVVLVSSLLSWMVPKGAAQVWIVDLPLSRGTEWNDWLAREIHRRTGEWDQAFLSVAFPHPHPGDFDIERFTGVKPFPVDEWLQRLERPTVTFVWREDRQWRPPKVGIKARGVARFAGRLHSDRKALEDQAQEIIQLARGLQREWPVIDFAVVGIGHPAGFPDWIEDIRKPVLDEVTEVEWCSRYAASHLVIGAHGSNMLLPSAHAGGFIELLPPERWGNYLQDIFLGQGDVRDTFFRCRFVPASTTAAELSMLAASILRKYPAFTVMMGGESSRHGGDYQTLRDRGRRSETHERWDRRSTT